MTGGSSIGAARAQGGREYVSEARKYRGADWLANNLEAMKKPAPSPFGMLVADILGQVYGGIYHLSHTALFHVRTDWSHPHALQVVVSHSLANHDGSELLGLVLLCHDTGVRLAISARARGYLELRFAHGASIMGTVPSIEKAVDLYRARYALPAEVPA